MKISGNDPWYPAPWVCVNGDKNYDGYPGVPIRLKLAAEFACSLSAGWSATARYELGAELIDRTMVDGLRMADVMIAHANGDKGRTDDK